MEYKREEKKIFDTCNQYVPQPFPNLGVGQSSGAFMGFWVPHEMGGGGDYLLYTQVHKGRKDNISPFDFKVISLVGDRYLTLFILWPAVSASLNSDLDCHQTGLSRCLIQC
jgi:hypothetical protein